MGPETRNKSKREMVATAIPDDRMKEMIAKESETTYDVELFSQEDITYTVQINETRNIASSCCYFKFHSRACKHMLLLKIQANILVENVSNMETLLSKFGVSSIPENELVMF
jgi:hypothetical protein